MEDTLSNQDLDASHTIIGTDSEATAAIRPRREFRAVAACGGLASLAAVVIGAGILIRPPTASAVPSFARQTGQPCATCHTAFPELTPFGRQFKLMGYTSGGTRCGDGSAKSDETQVPLSVMAWPATFTSVKSNLAPQSPAWQAPNINNNDWIPGQFSLFVAGQLYC